MSNFKHLYVAIATFANGLGFSITKVKASGACRITEVTTGVSTHAHSAVNAWKSVAYQAGINWRTGRTCELESKPERKAKPKVDGVKRYAVTVPDLTRRIHRTYKAKGWTPLNKETVTLDTDELVQMHDCYQQVVQGKVDSRLWHRGALVGRAA